MNLQTYMRPPAMTISGQNARHIRNDARVCRRCCRACQGDLQLNQSENRQENGHQQANNRELLSRGIWIIKLMWSRGATYSSFMHPLIARLQPSRLFCMGYLGEGVNIRHYNTKEALNATGRDAMANIEERCRQNILQLPVPPEESGDRQWCTQLFFHPIYVFNCV